MVYNKYLEELNVEHYFTNFTDPDDKRSELWEKQRQEFGFDDRETWCLDRIFAEWLYSRLRMFEDTDGEKMKALVFPYKGKKYTRPEMISLITDKTKEYIETDIWIDTKEEPYLDMKEAIAMLSIILPVLWINKTMPSSEVLEQQRKEYSFDETEVYRLYDTFAQWISSRIKLFDKVNIIDTSYYKFKIHGKELTQQECMDKIINLCDSYEKERNMDDLLEVLNIWKNIFPAMWW